MYLECPDSIRVFTSEKPMISGVYSKTNQIRRQKPVWYNSLKDMYIFTSTANKWSIAEPKYYNADKSLYLAVSESMNTKCPQDLDYKLWLKEYKGYKWKYGEDFSITSGKHDF